MSALDFALWELELLADDRDAFYAAHVLLSLLATMRDRDRRRAP